MGAEVAGVIVETADPSQVAFELRTDHRCQEVVTGGEVILEISEPHLGAFGDLA